MHFNQSQVYKHILPISFALIIAIMTFTSLFAISLMNTNSNELIEALNQENVSQKLLKEMSKSAKRRSSIIFEMLNTDDPFKNDDLYLEFNTVGTNFSVARTKFWDLSHDHACKPLLVKQGEISVINSPLQHKVYDLLQDGEREQARNLFLNSTLPKQKAVFRLLDELNEMEFNLFTNTSKKLKQNSSTVLTTVIVLDALGVLFSIMLTFHAIRKQRSSDEELSYIANTDILTKLPNRASFINQTNLQVQNNSDSTFVVIFFDIDHFKMINDNYGHKTGDEVLKKFSSLISSCVGENDILSRFGGDEFVLLLRSMSNKREIKSFVHKLSAKLKTSFVINNEEIFISSSMGVSFYPDDTLSTTELLKNADIAMYIGKASGRSCFKFYSQETSDLLKREHEVSHALQTTLKKAPDDNDLHLVYQPLYNIKNDSITECEALIRWQNAEGEVISPDEFIPLAEKSNLIEGVNLFVIDEACKQQCEWRENGVNNIRININLSGNKQIFNKLLKRLKNNLDSLDLEPALFGIELTERTLNEISESTINILENAREMGMKISIDDFGTDYSSLIYLKRLPVTTLKIDKEFIDGLPNDKENEALVKTIISLAHSLDLDVVAEGIETSAQFEYLKKNSCNIVQGYYLHTPVEGHQFHGPTIAA